jgi:glycosyltransferase involved in cell wall biosynthesis
MDYAPNVDAVRWFVADVLPLLPGIRFVIAGRNPTEAVRALAGANVTVTGAVADMRSWLAAAAVVTAPLRIARGIQNKVLEAMAMAKPVVATSAAFEGIEAEPGRDLIVADGVEAMADAIRRLLAAPAGAAAMGWSARLRVERSYSWDQRLAPLAEMVFPANRKAAA